MVREFFFSGKRVDSDEWVHGNLFVDDKGKKCEILVGYMNYRIAWEIIPETVGQYTGLTDRNGTKIFEGDIIKHLNNSDVGFDIGKVYWDDKYCQFCRTSNGDIHNYRISADCCYEVIGNIYDNPELVEV